MHQRTKFRKDRSNCCGDIAIFVIFQMAAAAILNFQKIQNFNGRSAVGYGDFTVFKMAAVRHLGFVKFNFLTVGADKRPILHQRTKFRNDRSNRCGSRYRDFCDFQDGGCRHVEFSKIQNFNGRSAVAGQCASSCQISSKSVKRLQRYGDLTVFKNGGRSPSWICEIRIF